MLIKKKTFGKIIAVLSITLAVVALLIPIISSAQAPTAGPPAPTVVPPAPTPAPPRIDPTSKDAACEAGWVACGIRSVFGWVIETILYLWFSFVSILINLAAGLIQTLIQISGQVPESPLVKRGFDISLGLANLGFVLAIIIIAFATILRLENYGAKKLLKNLIIAAILVNFSLAIAGAMLDFTGVFSTFFISKSSPGNIAGFASNMAASLDVSKLLAIKSNLNLGTVGNSLAAGIANFGGGLISLVVSLALGLLVAILIMIVFAGIAIMILIRYVYLTILLILMPFAWLCWTVPTLAQYWSKWWSTFLRWTFFLPAVTFFLYLAMAASSGVDALVLPTLTNNPAVTAGDQAVLQDFKGILNTFIKIGLFFGALLAGNALGVTGAAGALGAAKGVSNWAIGSIKGGAVGAGKYVGQRPAKATARGASQVLGGVKKGLGKIPLVGRLAGGLVPQRAINALAGLGSRKEDVEKLQKDLYSNLTNDQMKSASKEPLPAGPAHKAAFLAELSKRKMIGEVTKDMQDPQKEKFLTSLATAAKQTNPGTKASDIQAIKDILTISPSFAAKLTAIKTEKLDQEGNEIWKDESDKETTEKEIIVKFTPKINPAEAFKLANPELENEAVASSLSKAAITNIFRNSDEKTDILRTTLQKMVGSQLLDYTEKINAMREKLREVRTDDPKRPELEKLLNMAINVKKDALARAKPEQKAAFDRLEFMEQKIGAEPF